MQLVLTFFITKIRILIETLYSYIIDGNEQITRNIK